MILLLALIPFLYIPYVIWFTKRDAFRLGLEFEALIQGVGSDWVHHFQVVAEAESAGFSFRGAPTWKKANNCIGMNYPSGKTFAIGKYQTHDGVTAQSPAKYRNFFDCGRDAIAYMQRWKMNLGNLTNEVTSKYEIVEKCSFRLTQNRSGSSGYHMASYQSYLRNLKYHQDKTPPKYLMKRCFITALIFSSSLFYMIFKGIGLFSKFKRF